MYCKCTCQKDKSKPFMIKTILVKIPPRGFSCGKRNINSSQVPLIWYCDMIEYYDVIPYLNMEQCLRKLGYFG